MADVYVTTTSDKKPEIINLVRNLPAIIAGKVSDTHGISTGFRLRLGYTLFSLIAPNFEELGRGRTGVDGTRWPPLSPAYLAYGRRFGKGEMSALKKDAGLTKRHSFAPGDKKGLLTADQLKLWRRTYSDRLAWYIMRMPDDQAKGIAAAIAWNTVKRAGARTKLEVFGKRQAQILVDTGRLRQSLQPGSLLENGVSATYSKPAGGGGSDQVLESDGALIIVGSNDIKAKWHHKAKHKNRRRRLWPDVFPQDWWDQILGAGISGLQRIGELFNR